MNAAELCLALVRTTLATAAAACLAALLLAWLKVQSPRMHRIAWTLVVLQGWLLIPWTLKFEAPPAPAPAPSSGGMPSSAWAWSEFHTTGTQRETVEAVAHEAPRSMAPLTLLAWLTGAAILTLAAAWRYLRVVRALPLGAAPDVAQWRREWRRQRKCAMPSSAWACSPKVHLRLTDRLGPLVAFIPFAYLLLAPRSLWIALTPAERTTILRHELAHIRRRDLWKSLALRLLALPQWFNPLVWLAVRRFDEAAEWACDAAAARGLARETTTVANALLRTAELTASNSPMRAAHVLPAVPNTNDPRRRSTLARRIHRLVTPRSKEESTMRKLAVPVLLAALAAAQVVRIERVAASDPPPSKGREQPSTVAGGDRAQGGSLADTTETQSPAPAADNSPATAPGGWMHQPEPSPTPSADRREYLETAFPRYVIEPPDILSIEGVKLVPKPPYRIETFDEILIRVAGALPDQPIDDAYTVDADGAVNLGPQYGRVKIAGLTMEEGEKHLREELAKILTDVEVSFSLRQSAGFQAISGQHLVAMDGRVNLGVYGSVFVAGMTIEESREAIEKLLSKKLEDPQVAVDVLAYNSKVYYVILKGGERGDNVTRMPITGNETVLDAIAILGGIGSISDAKVWIARPAPNGVGGEQTLAVAWNEITNGKSTETNYQLHPGDRLFIETPREETDRTAKVQPAAAWTGPSPQPASSAYSATPSPAASAYAATPSAPPAVHKRVLFRIAVIHDRSGDMAELGRGLREGGALLVDAETLHGALRILDKHGLVKTIADPSLDTIVGLPVGTELTPGAGDAPTYVVLNPSRIGRDPEGHYVWVDIGFRKGEYPDHGVEIHFGQSYVLAARRPDRYAPLDNLGPGRTYLVITPELVD